MMAITFDMNKKTSINKISRKLKSAEINKTKPLTFFKKIIILIRKLDST